MSRSLGEIGTVANDEIRTIPSLGNFAKEKVPFKNKKTQRFSKLLLLRKPPFRKSYQLWMQSSILISRASGISI